MPLDDTLRSLLVAQGPSGYETAPSAAWRAAAERLQRRSDRRDGQPHGPRAQRGGRQPDGRVRRPHRRDRPDRHAHRRQGAPVLHRGRRLGSAGARQPARRRDDARRRRARRRRAQGDPPAGGGRAQEGRRAQGPLHRHRRARRRRGQGARSRRRRRRDRGRAASSCPTTASCRARWTTASAPTSRWRRRGSSPRAAARHGTWSRRSRCRRRSGSTARARSAHGLRPDVAIVVDVTHETDTLGVDRSGSARTRSARAP